MGAGIWSTVDQACEATIQIVDRITPHADQVAQYTALYPLYRGLYPTLKSTFDDLTAVDEVTMQVRGGEIFGLMGPDGAGKTTLFRMIVGEDRPDSGTLRLGETVQVAYVDQSRDDLDDEKTI